MSDFIDYLRNRYGVGKHYANAYIEYWNNTGKTYLSSEDGLNALREPESMWFEFALSANWRGRQLVKALNVPDAMPGQRYLDIGCGFGGMLAAFADKGYEVHGVELDPVRVALAKENMRDVGLGASVSSGSILDPVFIAQQPGFDLITCIDVIEHVSDVVTTVANATSMLTDGGSLHLEIPNLEAMDFILSDGHFSLFGITLLSRWAAIDYQRAHFGYEYDVGDYYPLDYYVGILKAQGLNVTAQPSPLQSRVDWSIAKDKARTLLGQLDTRLKQALPGVPDRVRPYLMHAVGAYRESLLTALEDASSNRGARDQFVSRFCANFWLVSAQKINRRSVA